MAAEASDSAAAAAPAEAAPGTSSDPSSPPFVDMTGVYELDKAASDPISLFLKEVGVPWVGRKAADSMTSTLTIRNSPTEFFVENKNFFSTNTNTMPIGKEADWTAGDGSKVPMTASIMSDGAVIIQGPMPKQEGKQLHNVHAKSGDGVVVTIAIVNADGSDVVRVRRVFKRKAASK